MVSDKPPRRSKSDKPPVTIDLSAEAVKTIATPVRSNDSDQIPDTGMATAPEASDQGTPDNTSADTLSATVSQADSAQEAKQETETLSHTPRQADTGMPGESNETASVPGGDASTTAGPADPIEAKPAPTASTSRPAPSTTALIAAGICGGIVALLLAGSMQYAGYLPGTGSGNGRGTADAGALQQQIDALNARLAAGPADLAGRIDALEGAVKAGNAGSDISGRLAVIESQLAEARSGAAASGELSQRLQSLETKVDQPGREDAVARALAASALKTAIDRGGPFTGELQTFSGIAKDDPAAQNLQRFAAQGVPSAAALVQKFPQAADAMLNATHGANPDESIGSRLISSAMQMVKVRPVGDVAGEEPEAIVARMEDRLRKGDLKGAAEQWNGLPQAAKDASTAYKQMLDARIEVDGLVDNTLNRAIAGAANAG